MRITHGFDSYVFAGGNFSFKLNGLINPLSVQHSDAFYLTVFDNKNRTEYSLMPSNQPAILQIDPSNFTTSKVENTNFTNGVSNPYKFYITFSVDTPVNSTLQIQIPQEITIDQTQNLTCSGLLYLATNLSCSILAPNLISVQLQPSDSKIQTISNCTTIGVQINSLVNPLSL